MKIYKIDFFKEFFCLKFILFFWVGGGWEGGFLIPLEIRKAPLGLLGKRKIKQENPLSLFDTGAIHPSIRISSGNS
jgi:hypothetical protein